MDEITRLTSALKDRDKEKLGNAIEALGKTGDTRAVPTLIELLKDTDPGVVVGTTYAANTVGAIFGSLLASLVFIPQFGTQHSHQLLLVVAAFSALLMLVFRPRMDSSQWVAGVHERSELAL